MAYNKTKEEETTQKTIRFPNDMISVIEKMAEEGERDFSKQVIFMVKKYIEIKGE